MWCGNTLEEAERLGNALGKAIESAVSRLEFRSNWQLGCGTVSVTLPLRKLPAADDAARTLREKRAAFAALRAADVPRAVARTAECDCFGAEEIESLVTAAAWVSWKKSPTRVFRRRYRLSALGRTFWSAGRVKSLRSLRYNFVTSFPVPRSSRSPTANFKVI